MEHGMFNRPSGMSDDAYAGMLQSLVDAGMAHQMPDDIKRWVDSFHTKAEHAKPGSTAGSMGMPRTPTPGDEPRPEEPLTSEGRRWTDTICILDGSEAIEPVDPTGRYSRGRTLQPKDRHPVFKAIRATPPKVVFVPGRDPYSLSNLYRQARIPKRGIRIEMAQARVDGVLGTVIKNVGPVGNGE